MKEIHQNEVVKLYEACNVIETHAGALQEAMGTIPLTQCARYLGEAYRALQGLRLTQQTAKEFVVVPGENLLSEKENERLKELEKKQQPPQPGEIA